MKYAVIIIAAVAFNVAGMFLAMAGIAAHLPALSFLGGSMIGMFGIWGGFLLAEFVRDAQS